MSNVHSKNGGMTQQFKIVPQFIFSKAISVAIVAIYCLYLACYLHGLECCFKNLWQCIKLPSLNLC